MVPVYRARGPAVLNVPDTGWRNLDGAAGAAHRVSVGSADLTFGRSSSFTSQQTRTRRTAMTATHTTVDSPLGELTLVAEDGRLTGVYFPHHWYKPDPASFGPRTDTGFEEAKAQLAEYFAGDRTRFDLPVEARGDKFQRRVWDLIEAVPYGQTVTSGDLARGAGHAQGRRRGRRAQPPQRGRAVPPRGRQGRPAHRLRRRAGAQEVPARPGRGIRKAVLVNLPSADSTWEYVGSREEDEKAL